jgi:hypothetical protein
MPGIEARLPLDALRNAVRTVTESGAMPVIWVATTPSPGRTSPVARAKGWEGCRSSISTRMP